MDAQQRGPAVGQPPHALEADREVEVATGVEEALGEGLDARELAAAQPQPGPGVGADHDVRAARRDALADPRPVGGAAHLPGVADVAQADVVGGVEAGLGAEIPVGERPERVLDEREAPGVGRAAGQGGGPYTQMWAERCSHIRPFPAFCGKTRPADTLAAVRTVRLHDTRSRELRELVPRDPGRVGLYACGPTVYNRIHVGNARPFVVFSLLKRFLEHEGLATTLVINITDVNDKIYDAARAQGIPSAQLAEEMTEAYLADTGALGLGRPDHEPLAGETMGPIVELIGALIEGGHAYAADGDVYFRVRSDGQYGSLSRRDVDEMDQGEGIEGADRKEDPLDFALWKAQKEGEDTAWDAPWGRGRPGWHIECSAMAEQLLGVGFDVHGGGNDLVFPHHENEAAQTRCARGAELARIWMHNGMLQMGSEKMAKSVGNVALLHEVLGRWDRDTLVWFFCTGHYRQPLAFTEEALEQAAATVRRLRELARRLAPGPSPERLAPVRERFFDALADDFNTPRALEALAEWRRGAADGDGDADLREMLGVLGLESLLDAADAAPETVVALAREREAAREARDFDASDRLRDEIAAAGWVVRDVPGGFELVPAE